MLKTIWNRKKRTGRAGWILFTMLIVLFEYNSVLVSAEENPVENLHARAAVLMDGESGRVLYGKEENQQLPMASTTKIMTCILALEYQEGNRECVTSAYAASQPKVRMGAQKGEIFFLEDLLYTMMLESHNDAAVIIAESIGGSVEGFAALMNRKAEKLGLENTHFVTPNGLDADGHYTTAKELARIMKYCLYESPERETFIKITSTRNYEFWDKSKTRHYCAVNHNAFLDMMEGAVSGKTGFTGNAGYCYVAGVETNGKKLILALLACGWPSHRTYKWEDCKTLIHYGISEYEYRMVRISGTFPTRIVQDGEYDWRREQEARVAIVPEKTGSFIALLQKQEALSLIITLRQELKAPVKKGDPVGEIQYLSGGNIVFSCRLRAAEAVNTRSGFWNLEYLWNRFLLN